MPTLIQHFSHVFFLVYAGLFPIVNPVGNAPIFLVLTRYCSDGGRCHNLYLLLVLPSLPRFRLTKIEMDWGPSCPRAKREIAETHCSDSTCDRLQAISRGKMIRRCLSSKMKRWRREKVTAVESLRSGP